MDVKLWKSIQRMAIIDPTLQQPNVWKRCQHTVERGRLFDRQLWESLRYTSMSGGMSLSPRSTKKVPQMMKGVSERCETPDSLENNSGRKALRYRHGGGGADSLEQWQKISPGKSSLELMMGCQETEKHLHSKGNYHKGEEKAFTVGRNFADCVSDRWLIFDLYE